MRLRHLHRASAFVLVAYAFLHIANHLAALHSVSAHVEVMDFLRKLYRQPLVELLLLACVAFQVCSGLLLAVRGWAARVGRVAWLQAISGMYLALFLLIHVGAVLIGRSVLHLDTNFFYAAAGFHVHPYQWFFAPYYSLAVAALFAHLGCALYWMFDAPQRKKAVLLLAGTLGLGVLFSALITLSLAGAFAPVEVPDEYKATYGA